MYEEEVVGFIRYLIFWSLFLGWRVLFLVLRGVIFLYRSFRKSGETWGRLVFFFGLYWEWGLEFVRWLIVFKVCFWRCSFYYKCVFFSLLVFKVVYLGRVCWVVLLRLVVEVVRSVWGSGGVFVFKKSVNSGVIFGCIYILESFRIWKYLLLGS